MEDFAGFEQDRLKVHAELFDRMGQRLGLDLQEEAIAGRLDFEEIAEGVLRCTRCAYPGTCRDWLAASAAQRLAQDTPEYCRNRDLLGYLREFAG